MIRKALARFAVDVQRVGETRKFVIPDRREAYAGAC